MIDQVQGKLAVLSIKVAGVWTPFVCSIDFSISHSTDMIETSVSGSGLFATFLPTKNSFTANFNGIVAIVAPGNLKLSDLRALQFAQTVFEIQIERTDKAGNAYTETGFAFITSSSDTGSFDGMNTFSVDMQGTGAITQISTP